QPHDLLRTEGFLIEVESQVGPADDEIRRDRVVSRRDRLYCHVSIPFTEFFHRTLNRDSWSCFFPPREASSFVSAAGSTGLTRWKSKPASLARFRSASWPQPVMAIRTICFPHSCCRIRFAAS